jgi:hypothetical protein
MPPVMKYYRRLFFVAFALRRAALHESAEAERNTQKLIWKTDSFQEDFAYLEPIFDLSPQVFRSRAFRFSQLVRAAQAFKWLFLDTASSRRK